MLTDREEFQSLLDTVIKLVKLNDRYKTADIIANAEVWIECKNQDNRNERVNYHVVYISIDVELFIPLQNNLQKVEEEILEKFKLATRYQSNEVINSVIFIPKEHKQINWKLLEGWLTKDSLIKEIELLKDVMNRVATFQQSILKVNDTYKERYRTVHNALLKLKFNNPNQYLDLWDWHAKYKSDFKTYHERRNYIHELYKNLLNQLKETKYAESVSVTVDLKGWDRIERSISEIKVREASARGEEQYQAIGLLCRETIVSLAQEVFKKDRHPILDQTDISKTDAKRMLESYIAIELESQTNESIRRFVKASLDVANALTHKRTATKKDASLCMVATLSLINLIGIVEGRFFNSS